MKMLRVLARTVLIGGLVLIATGCTGHPDAAVAEYDADVARIISHVTGGTVFPDELITLRFTRPMRPQGADSTASQRAVSFRPRLDGTLQWSDPQTIVFTPDRPLTMRSAYQGYVDIKQLLSSSGASTEELPGALTEKPFVFSFAVAGREIAAESSQFLLEEQDDPSSLVMSGNIAFTLPTALEDVSRAFRVRVDGTPLDISLSGSGTSFHYVSRPIERDKDSHVIAISISDSRLQLSADYERELTLPPLHVFAVGGISVEHSGHSAGMKVTFSDELSRTQDITGLVRVEEVKDVQTVKRGNAVYLHGDFVPGNTYNVMVSRGVQSRFGTATAKTVVQQVAVSDMKPQIEFVQSGVFLPTSGQRKIYLRTVNVRKVHLLVKKVFENNLGQFLQTEQLTGNGDRNQRFSTSYVNRVGVTVADQDLHIGESRNQWLIHEIDLSKLIDATDKGLFLLSVTFEREDMIYELDEGGARYYSGEEYYSNPNSWGYLYAHGRIYKPVAVSDIGLTWKSGTRNHTVFATDIASTRPLAGVEVTLKTYQNQTVGHGTTDTSGQVSFDNIAESVFYVTGEKAGQRTMIKANEMAWNLSSFDTGGRELSREGVQAFVYTERGVYRPGDQIHLSAVFRNSEGTFPENHPVHLKVTNPRGQPFAERTVNQASDGFYAFTFETPEDAPTGIWQAELTAGSSSFTTEVPIETIVPNRLKISFEPGKETILPGDRYLPIVFTSSYLFGAPAAGLEAELSVKLTEREKKVARYPGFIFTNEATSYAATEQTLFRDRLSAQGSAQTLWELPSFRNAPSALDAVFSASVQEPGGRATHQVFTVPVEPYRYYVGLSKPDMPYGYIHIGAPTDFPFVTVSTDGMPAAGRPVTYKVYRNSRYWWWEYDSYDEYRVRYKSDSNTTLVSQGQAVSGVTPSTIRFEPEGWGEYFLEVTDRGSGHTAGFFFRASSWATQGQGQSEGILSVQRDRDVYHPGDTATVTVPTPPDGRLLVTVERDAEVLSWQWKEPMQTETRIAIPVTAEMIPNAYVTISLLQPHSQTLNDRPIRMYGIVPLLVEDPASRQQLTISTQDVLSPNTPFTVDVQATDRQPTQLTLAVVDEGLLDLTGFHTPNPWNSFYAKRRLAVTSMDAYGEVIGAFSGDVYRVFAVGGGEAALLAQLGDASQDPRQRRFEPVSLVSGPVMTDSRGHARFTFTMPNYMGSVRIMAVSAHGTRYGSADKSVPVRQDVVALPTLPRVIGPGEQFRLPVSLFSTTDSAATARVSVRSEGPVHVRGTTTRSVALDPNGDAQVYFDLESDAAVGTAKITLTVDAGREHTVLPTTLAVRASSPVIFADSEKSVRPGASVSLAAPADGLPGTNRAVLTVSTRQDLNLENRLRWLIHYPYGCIEQTVSSAFPQLYLRSFVSKKETLSEMDANVNAAIDRLRRFQLPSGAFSYWPGQPEPSIWGTNYAGHFMTEARALGYQVPDDLYDGWLRFENSRALSTADSLPERVYRVYLLSAAGKPSVGALNLIRENSRADLNDVGRWQLAAAYRMAGLSAAAEELSRGAGTRVEEYHEFGGTYGSALRDTAIILESAIALDRNAVADDLSSVISERLASDEWYSTQTTGFALMAVGKYLESLKRSDGARLTGDILMPGGNTMAFDTSRAVFTADLTDALYPPGWRPGQTSIPLSVRLSEESGYERAFARLQWEGQPLSYQGDQVQSHLELDVQWFDRDGRRVDVSELTQGVEFWGRFTLRKTDQLHISMEEMALTQILPSGWEVVNTRLSGEELPAWLGLRGKGEADYQDIRDDRVSWFFDLPRDTREMSFAIKLQAVTAGTFTLPPTTAGAMYRHDYRALLPGQRVQVRRAP